ncbi:3979_t:CDS:2 [Funneliformis geosporum]|uniref:3979_t:CDS:1 n=1 Tax=Funneliformis geosporum TaxID=1117311 RepID=A0A9W4SP26_9GLOM|nr:3979_t:CDS:2 [Funneliformis geosporum]
MPCSTTLKPIYPFEVWVENLANNGRNGKVMVDQIKSIDKERLLGRAVNRLNENQLVKVNEILLKLLNQITKKAKIKYLDISNRDLAGNADLSEFTNLQSSILMDLLEYAQSLVARGHTNHNAHTTYLKELVQAKPTEVINTEIKPKTEQIPNKNLNNNAYLLVGDNQLTNLNFLNNLNEEKLTGLYIQNNNFPESDLTPLSKFINLEILELNNNNFVGSLQPLVGSNKLKHLTISNTDIDSGLEYLPESLEKFYCSADEKPEAKVKVVYDLLADEKPEAETYESYREVVLKSLNNSSDNIGFLQEVAKHKNIDDWFDNIVPCYGISRHPENKNYLMVMQYMPEGNLRHYLGNKNQELGIGNKIGQLANIAQGLKDIHAKNLVHRDFHSGNILKGIERTGCLITDLGLCRPANEAKQEDKVFGVMPYVAPEVLRQQPYTQASDIYSFGIVAYEILSGLPPYYDQAHDVNTDPKKRPTASELERISREWQREIDKYHYYYGNSEFKKQLLKAEESNEKLSDKIKFPDYQGKKHSGAVYTSRLLPTKEITKLLNKLEIDPCLIDDNLKALAREFIRANKESIKNEKDVEAMARVEKLSKVFQGSLVIENYSELEDLLIENCPQLKILNLSSNSLTNSEFLANLESLEKLELDGNTELTELIEKSIKEKVVNQLDSELSEISKRIVERKGSFSESGNTDELTSIAGEVVKNLKGINENLKNELAESDSKVQELEEKFRAKEEEISRLELRLQGLVEASKIQKEKIINSLLQVFPEKRLLQELIGTHLEFTKAKKQKLPSRKLEKECQRIKNELEERLNDDEELMEKVETILTDCEELVDQELELEAKIGGKTSLIESKKQILLQMPNGREKDEKIRQLELELAKTKGQLEESRLVKPTQFFNFSGASQQVAIGDNSSFTNYQIQYNIQQKLKSELTELKQSYQSLESINEPATDPQKLKKTILLLATKKILANTRQNTINSLITTEEKSEKTSRIAIRLESIGQLIGNVEDFADIVPGGKIATRLLSKGLPIAANLLKKRSLKSQAKEFKDCLIEDEKTLALLQETYKSLDKSLQSEKQGKMNSALANLLSLGQEQIDRYSVFKIGDLKEEEKLTAEKINQVIDDLTECLESLVQELKNEVGKFAEEIETLAEDDKLLLEVEELLNKLSEQTSRPQTEAQILQPPKNS